MEASRCLALGFVAVLLTAAVVPAAADISKSPERDSILVEILGSQFTTFVALLEQADLLDVLEKELKELDGVTIFIPTDFHLLHKVSPSLLSFLRQPKNMALLQKVLLYHFLPYRVAPEEWTASYQTLEGSEARLVARGAAFEIEGHSVREMDALLADDGVVHALNGLLIPSDLKSILARFMAERSSDYLPLSLPERRVLSKMSARVYHSFAYSKAVVVASSPPGAAAPAPAPAPAATPPSIAPAPGPAAVAPVNDETILVDALTKLGDYKIFLSLLQMTGLGAVLARYKGPLTLLIPDDKAFMALEANGQLATLSQDKDVLYVLLYHAIRGYFPQSALLSKGAVVGKAATQSVPTLANVSLPITESGGVVYFGNPPVAVTTPNIVSTTNGNGGGLSVQGLDGVLIPPGLLATLAPAPSPTTSSTPSTSAPPPPPTKGSGAQISVDFRYLAALACVLAGGVLL